MQAKEQRSPSMPTCDPAISLYHLQWNHLASVPGQAALDLVYELGPHMHVKSLNNLHIFQVNIPAINFVLIH